MRNGLARRDTVQVAPEDLHRAHVVDFVGPEDVEAPHADRGEPVTRAVRQWYSVDYATFWGLTPTVGPNDHPEEIYEDAWFEYGPWSFQPYMEPGFQLVLGEGRFKHENLPYPPPEYRWYRHHGDDTYSLQKKDFQRDSTLL